MGKERRRPTYSLAAAKALAASGEISMNRRIRAFVKNRTDWASVSDFIRELFMAADEAHFSKSMDLDIIPGTWADVYKIPFDGETWYVKFFIEGDSVRLNVLSANWDGYIH